MLQDLKTRYLAVQKREAGRDAHFWRRSSPSRGAESGAPGYHAQIYQELQQLTASYKNEFDVAQSRAVSLRQSIEGVVGKNSEANRSLVQLNELNQKRRR